MEDADFQETDRPVPEVFQVSRVDTSVLQLVVRFVRAVFDAQFMKRTGGALGQIAVVSVGWHGKPRRNEAGTDRGESSKAV